jgi:hypothetical protein
MKRQSEPSLREQLTVIGQTHVAPGAKVPNTGSYRCLVCRTVRLLRKGQRAPTCGRHTADWLLFKARSK